MIAVKGTYENGVVRLEKKIRAKRTRKVIVTFLDEETTDEPKRLKLGDFSFLKAREKSKGINGSLAETIIEERKNEL